MDTRLDTLRMHAKSAAAWARLAPWAPVLLLGVDGLLRARAALHPEQACLRDLEQTLSYRDVDADVNRAALLWRRRGVGPGDVVAIVAHNWLDVLIHQLGLSRIGAAAALVSPEMRGGARAHVLAAAGARELVDDAGLDALVESARALPTDAVLGPLNVLANPACYLFTSGTTGLPKAAAVSNGRYLMAGVALQGYAAWLKPADVVFTPLPLYHASAHLAGLSLALSAGACFAIAPKFSASRYWAQARGVGATVGLYVGEVCRYLLAQPREPHGIHMFIGNGLRADVWPRFLAHCGVGRVVEFYGATEGNTALVNRTGKVGSCGRPVVPRWLHGLKLARYDLEHERYHRVAGRIQRSEAGEPGELLSRISWLPIERFDGYVDVAATEAKILSGAFRRHDRYFRTGDLLRQDAEGDYFFVDRLGDTFRWKGENVSTQEVAEVLAGVPGVDAVVVYGVEVPGEEGRAGMAALVGDFDLGALFRAVQVLPRAARPQFVRRVGELETTSTMKFTKTALVAAGYGPEAAPAWALGASSYLEIV